MCFCQYKYKCEQLRQQGKKSLLFGLRTLAKIALFDVNENVLSIILLH